MTTKDAQHFQTFGFVTWKQLLTPDEVEAISAELLMVMEDGYAETPFDGSQRHWLPLLSPKAPVIAGLAEDPRFYDKAKEIVDDDVVLMMADANRYIDDTGWHPDSKGARGVKFFIYLAPVRANSGALRVIPGSHAWPYHDEVTKYWQENAPGVEDLPSYAFECEPGDVLAFDYPIYHSSIGGSKDRRMCTVEYYKKPANEADAVEIRGHVGAIAKITDDSFKRSGYPFYDPEWIARAEGNPTRAKLVEGMRDAGLLEAAGVPAMSS